MKRTTSIAAAATLIAYSLRTFGADGAGDSGARCQLDVSSQPLEGALQEVARQCDVQLLYFSQITAGMTAEGLKGSYTVESALLQLLDQTGLTFRHVNATTIEIQRPSAGPAVVAAPDRESDQNEPLDEIIIRGTAEGLVATRIETSLREIPQTISVVSQEQMRQQNNFSLSDVVEDVSGITSIRQDSQFQVNYSRGFEINSYTLDSGGSLRDFTQTIFGPILLLPDLAEFDHVDVLRGANALYGANASPGGAINLVRKRPLHDARITFSTSGGSWNSFRAELDATGPLALDGA
ncbi:MAG: TonB-dependent receptor plug domain-containing protein, partial [Steroidobacteraceae bacterium]